MSKLSINAPAPFFSAPNQDGEILSLNEYKGKLLVLFFYPRDNTPTCTNEVCNLRDNYQALLNKGVHLLGISNDSAKSHTKFITKFNLPFDLLADEDKKIVTDYGVYGEKQFMGRTIEGIYRTTFVINEKGIIIGIIDKVVSKEHAAQVLELIS